MGINLSNELKTHVDYGSWFTSTIGSEPLTTTITVDDINKYNEIKEKDDMIINNKYEKILKIYKEREYEYIDQEYIAAKSEIIEKDKIHAIYVEYINKIKEAYEKENKTEMPCMLWNGGDFLTKKTEEKLKVIEKERSLNEHNLEEKLEEIKARLEMTDDYDKQIEILKIYGILNEEGMINA